MAKLTDLIGCELKWSQPNTFKMEYELRSGDLAVATLRFRSSFGTLATAESADGCWTFKRVGFWQPRVTVRPCNSETELAQFKVDAWKGGGTLEMADGRKFLASASMWKFTYDLKTEAGEDLIHFDGLRGLLHVSSGMQILPAAARLPELPWMALLGWYLLIMTYMDSAAAVAATSAAAAAAV